MRTKILLFFSLFLCGVLNAQVDDTIRTLIISEVRLDDARRGYIEIANVGATAVNLKDFEIGRIDAWTTPWGNPTANWLMLPDKELAPGATFIIAAMRDFSPEMAKSNPEQYDPLATNKKEFWTLADIQDHVDEQSVGNPAGDSISPAHGRELLTVWNGRDCFYLRYHIGGDSTVVDQVNGIFGGANNQRPEPKGGVSVAGVDNATQTCTLVRKFSVTTGNLNFASAKGNDLTESEWIPVPHQAGGRWADNTRRLFWTAGFHGDAVIEDGTLVPLDKFASSVAVDWAAKTITVPWGTRRDDSIMFMFNKVPGLAWHYNYINSYEDSAFVSARTGDSLTVYATGNELTLAKFGIIVTPATNDAKIVVPKKAPNGDGFYDDVDDPVYTITDGLEMDTIGTLRFFGVPFATRIDTLYKYIEAPEGANLDIVFVDGNERTDLKEGDILKVTAADNSTKEYYIKVDRYRKDHNAFLSSITWPDIPADYRGLFGWMGDTIPNFVASSYEYVIQVPPNTVGVPALVGKNQSLQGKHTVEIATTLDGSAADKTVTFNTVAEDDTSTKTYTVQVQKMQDPASVQPWDGDPFISEWVFWEQWGEKNWIELANPRPGEMDMSHYMVVVSWENNPAAAISNTRTEADQWLNRYRRYVPGYKWVDSLTWTTNPGMLVQDLAVNPVVKGGDVFVLATVNGGRGMEPATNWWAVKQTDVLLSRLGGAYPNPWNENIGEGIAHWMNNNIYLFRIDNDSILTGLKNANDPKDFTLLDVMGNGDGSEMVIGGRAVQMIEAYTRKPNIYKGNPVIKGSAGTTMENSEWIMKNGDTYSSAGWPNNILFITKDIGSHFMNDVTIYRSSVTSSVYKVSPGYSQAETIRGVITNTDVDGLFANVIKADAGQVLNVVSATSGETLAPTDSVENGDTLVVLSADAKNTSKYILEVTEGGLNNDATLTSEHWDIAVEGNAGVISGFDPFMSFKNFMDSIEVPAGAVVIATGADGKYVPYTMLNFDTAYVAVPVSNQIVLTVTAENGVNKITYTLEPAGTDADAYVTSSIFGVDQNLSVIFLIPPGTPVSNFLAGLTPAPGATIELQDKFGYVREIGTVISDDTLVVTAADETTIRKYGLGMLGGLSLSDMAYVISEVYLVDQDGKVISGDDITIGISVAAFKANLIASTGASIAITNAAGQPKNSGNMAEGDLVKVISANGSNIVTYTINFHVAVNNNTKDNLVVFPNPGRGLFTISGIKAGNRIQVTNIIGVKVAEKVAVADRESVSIEKENNGIYFITISDNNNVVGRYKIVKE
jgi:hypothetical protein